MGFFRKPAVAATVMVLMIIVGTLTGSHASLNRMRNEALRVFANGINGDGIGIQNDLNERTSAAYNMTTIAGKYLPENNVVIREVLLAREEALKASTLSEKLAADRKLETTVLDLYQVMSSLALSPQDERYPARLYTDFTSRGSTISHDPYHQVAATFNEALTGFPANILGRLTGVTALPAFR